MEVRQLTEEQVTLAKTRAAEYVGVIVDAYNQEVRKKTWSSDEELIEGTAILNSMIGSTLAVMSSLVAGQKDDLVCLLKQHIDALQKSIEMIEKIDQNSYKAIDDEATRLACNDIIKSLIPDDLKVESQEDLNLPTP